MNNYNYFCEIVKEQEVTVPKVTPAYGNIYNRSSKKFAIFNP